ncbi:hypothetical protein [Sphingomonas humi]|uniref:Uncharacterized protein n=1 Tax=Sphingomonas humi TaxID=335630 RepID=A0ABP7S2K9_9SPHN
MLSHVAIALLIQLAVTRGLRTNWWAGAAAAACWAISREITQAEYRWIEAYGGGLRANMPWWGGFDPRVWHLDAMVDWALPTVVVAAVALLASVSSARSNRARR